MANKAKVKTGKGMLLRSVPVDVQRVVLAKIREEEEHCKCVRGQDYALYKIVREWGDSVGAPGGPLVVCLGGQFVAPGDVSVEVVGSRVSVTFSVPITTPVGALLNYGRQEIKG